MMRDLFIWCSGASVEIVKKCDDKEISKYTNIGIVVFCVAFLSVFSATYFLSFAFNTEGTEFMWLYLPIGIVWGFIILSLDRAIVSTISKNDTLSVQIFKSIPRFALALMIGIVVATPLEVKIFEKEVDNVIKDKVAKIVKDNIEKDYQSRLSFWEQKVKEAQSKYDIDKSMYEDEVAGKKSGIPGKGARANEYMRNELNSLDKLNIARDSLNNVRQDIVNVGQNTNWQKEIDDYIKGNIGVIERVKALYSLGNTHLAITILFVLVELLPLLTKLMSNKGAYDQLILDEEQNALEVANLKNEKEAELKKDMLDARNKKQVESTKIKAEIEQNLQKEILTELAKAQNQIAMKRVKEFKQNNLNNLNIPKVQQPTNSAKLENIFWQQIGGDKKTQFLFRNGMPNNNEFRLYEENIVSKGTWNYNQTKSEIITETLGDKREYEIVEIQLDRLKLKFKGTDYYLEFEKV